jgi:hypothetical protein
MTPFKHLLEYPQPDHTKVLTAGGNYVNAQFRGNVTIKQANNTLTLKDVLYIPSTL